MTRLTLALAAVTIIALLILLAPSSNGEWVETSHFEWQRTGASVSHDAQCVQQYGAGHTCVEWCEVYHGGIVAPTGQYCCELTGMACTKPM